MKDNFRVNLHEGESHDSIADTILQTTCIKNYKNMLKICLYKDILNVKCFVKMIVKRLLKKVYLGYKLIFILHV